MRTKFPVSHVVPGPHVKFLNSQLMSNFRVRIKFFCQKVIVSRLFFSLCFLLYGKPLDHHLVPLYSVKISGLTGFSWYFNKYCIKGWSLWFYLLFSEDFLDLKRSDDLFSNLVLRTFCEVIVLLLVVLSF